MKMGVFLIIILILFVCKSFIFHRPMGGPYLLSNCLIMLMHGISTKYPKYSCIIYALPDYFISDLFIIIIIKKWKNFIFAFLLLTCAPTQYYI